MAEEKRAKSPMDKVWDLFTSLKLAITVLIILAVASIFGTIIEQNQPLEKYRQFYSDSTIRLLDSMWMFDMYHAWWFLLLLVLFTVNLACCTIDRFPRVLKVVRNPKTTLDETLEKTMGMVDRWKKNGSLEAWTEKYREAVGKAVGKTRVTERDGAVHLYAETGVVSRFGVYVTHTSIIIIFIGAIVGNVFGFKGFANIVEGQSVRTIPTRGGTTPVDLGFEVRCNKFSLTFYTDQHGHQTQQPKEYASDLSVLEDGREVLRKKIVVNDPLQYKGIWFYQSSYGQAGGTTAQVAVRDAAGNTVGTLSLQRDQKMEISGYGAVTGVGFQPNYMGMGPALLLLVEKPGKPPVELWLPQGRPDFDRQRKDTYHFSFGGLNELFYTGLQVARDPGVNIVWVGCALMVVGIIIAFFMSHQRLWVRLAKGTDGRIEVVLAGSASRNKLAFEKKYEKIQQELKAITL